MQFEWIDFYSEFATKLLEFKDNRVELIADIQSAYTPEEWLDGFNTFSIYQVLPQLIELWGLNVQTDVSAKKNFVQQIAR